MSTTDKIDIEALNGMTREQAIDAYETWQDSLKSVSLDEVTTDEIPVKIIEYKTEDYTDEGGVKQQRRRSYVRSTVLSTKVPVSVLNELNRAQAALRKKLKDKNLPDEDKAAASFDLAIDMVLAVWRLTEEHMTKKRLSDGLDENEIGWLFNRFFGQKLRLQKQ